MGSLYAWLGFEIRKGRVCFNHTKSIRSCGVENYGARNLFKACYLHWIGLGQMGLFGFDGWPREGSPAASVKNQGSRLIAACSLPLANLLSMRTGISHDATGSKR